MDEPLERRKVLIGQVVLGLVLDYFNLAIEALREMHVDDRDYCFRALIGHPKTGALLRQFWVENDTQDYAREVLRVLDYWDEHKNPELIIRLITETFEVMDPTELEKWLEYWQKRSGPHSEALAAFASQLLASRRQNQLSFETVSDQPAGR